MISEVKPSVITIPSTFGRTRTVLLTGLCTAVAVAVAFDPPTPQWARHAPSLAAYLAVVASVAALLVYQGWRTGVRFDGHGLTIRYFFGPDRLGWHEVSRFADGCTAGLGEGAGQVWALDVVLHDGRVVTVKATARDSSSAAPKVLTAVLQAAELYGIQAPLTGIASKRRSRASVDENPPEPVPGPEAGSILSEWATSREFSTTRLRPGYDIEEVDAFLEGIRQTFLGIRKPSLTTDEIRNKKFSTTRLRPGYDEEEVDAFLNAVELRLAALTRPGEHGGSQLLVRCPECGTETGDPTRPCAQCGAPAVTQPSVAADPAVGQRAEGARPEPERPIRRAMAFAGSGLALLAGVAGLSSQILYYSSYNPGVYYFGLVAFLLPTVVAVVALRRIGQLVIVGLLQGMWWPAVAFVAADVVSSSADHMFGETGRFLAGYWVLVVSDVLGAAAAILLVVSWSPAVGWRRASRLRLLPVVLLCGVGLSQIVVWIFYGTQFKFAADHVLGIAGLLVGLAVTWYAVNLRASALGGALVLGWSTVTALWLLAGMSPWTAIGVLGCVLLAAVMVLARIYMRLPDIPTS